MASFSAARWIAPFGRSPSQCFYIDDEGLSSVRSHLKLTSASKGENVVITRLHEAGLFRDGVETALGVFTTSPAQTYLDLAQAGERGREAADHLRREKLSWSR